MLSEKLMQPHPKCTVSAVRVGQEQQPVLIIDNYLDQAERLIDYVADAAVFKGVEQGYYPGTRAVAPSFHSDTFCLYLGKLLAEAFDVKLENFSHSKSSFSMVTTRPEQLAPSQARPHIDSTSSTTIAVIHYLCAANLGGTSLYRHKATGFETLSEERMPLIRADYANELNDISWQKKYICGGNQNYDQIFSIDASFNRAVFYRCNSLHSGNIASDFDFDPNPRTGRLTATTFIYSKDS